MRAHPDHGPRVTFKDDRDSAIGRGCRLYAAHFRPEILAIMGAVVNALAEDATVDEIKFSEGHRKIRESRDCHETCDALDATAEMAGGTRIPKAAYERVAAKIRAKLGPNYDVLAHGLGTNLHIHVEWDPKNRRAKV